MKDKKKQCLLKRKQENDRGCENMFEEDEQVRLTGAGEGVNETPKRRVVCCSFLLGLTSFI